MPPQNSQVSNTNKSFELLGALIILILVVVGGVYYLSQNSNHDKPISIPIKSSTQMAVTGQFGKSTAVVSKVLPAQFPADIPIEKGNITENYKVTYNSTGMTQYTVSYTSSKTKTALWNIYDTYMKANNYALNLKLTNQTNGTLSGTLANASLVVVISSTTSVSTVHLTYILNK